MPFDTTGNMDYIRASDFDPKEIRKYTLEWLRVRSPDEVAGAKTLPLDIFWELYKSIEPVGEDWNRLEDVRLTLLMNDSKGVDERLTTFYETVYKVKHDPSYGHRVSDNFLWLKYSDSSFYAAPVPSRSLANPTAFDVMDYTNLYNRIADCLLFPVSEEEHIQARMIVDAFISAERGRF